MLKQVFVITTLLFFSMTSYGQVGCPPNVDFEQGNYGNWLFYTGFCCPISTPTFTGPLSNRHVLTSGAGTDIFGGFPVVAPGGGSYSLKLGNASTGAQAERARYYVHVPNNQNNYSLVYRYAVVFQNPSHTAAEQPRFEVTAYDSATNAIVPCAQFNYVATANIPGFMLAPVGLQVWYKDWTTASLDLSGLAGKTIAVDFAAGDCSQGGHFGYGYLDMNCSLFQIVSVNCNGSPTTALSAPPGFQSYQWWNSNYTAVVGTGQNVTIPTPSANTQYHVVLTPYTGFGCPDTLTTTVNVTSLNVTASNDTVICSGSSISLNATAVSTATTINYSWSPAAGLSCTNCTSPTVTPTNNSTYYVTASDGNGCTHSDTVHVNVDALSVNTVAQHGNCLGTGTGAITANASSGYSPYTYSWNTSPLQTTPVATGLSAGIYTVTVTDSIGCSISVADTILQGTSSISASVSGATHVTCFGASNGSATASTTGGVAPYTFSWNTSPLQSGSTATGLSAGNYTVTVTDNQGCTAVQGVTITEPAGMNATTTTTNVVCPGNNGSATALVTGGIAPYSYSWNTTPQQTTATISNLGTGTYIATITDGLGCTTTATATIISSQSTVNVSSSIITNITCHGGTNGSAFASASGGAAPYSYSWSSIPNQTTPTAINLAAGNYTVTVTDNNGCSGTASVSISQPTAPVSATISNVANISCNGASTASTTVFASGGSGSYTYTWNTSPAQTSATATTLAAGTYIVTVTDANGCTASQIATITQPPALNASLVSATNPQCAGSNTGSATVVATGGNSPYSYSWNTIPVQNNPTASNLAPGTYVATIVDNNGCSDTVAITINQPNPMTIGLSVSNLFCNGGSNGSMTANVTGGTGPYTYSWNTTPVQTSGTATTLAAGTYTVTVTDANGCTASQIATITQPPALNASLVSATNPQCAGSNTGSATVVATGGNSPYSYSWNTIPVQNNPTAGNLAPGTYVATIVDNNGCSDTVAITINQPNPMTIGLSVSNLFCSGGNNGNVTANVTGGTGPYTYSWNTTPAQTSATATTLAAGTYTVTVTDANGCTASQIATITQPPALNASLVSATNPQCAGSNTGSATVVATGGNSPFSYSWNTIPVQNSPNASNLAPGTYVATIVDNNGCSDTIAVTINQPTPMIIGLSVSNLFCSGGSNGSVTANVTGGTGPYTYSWNTTPAQTSATATSLTAGTYTVTITDANGCTNTASATIAMPSSPVNASITNVTPALCHGSSTGSATAAAMGGTAPYNYYWNCSPFQTTATASGLPAGNYIVTVTDNNGCSDTAQVTINQPVSGVNVTLNSTTHVMCHDGTNGGASITATGGTGPYTYSWNTTPVQTTATLSNVASGNYTVVVSDAGGCSASHSVTITEPPSVNISVSSASMVSCNGGTNGSASVVGAGGVPPYSYAWSTLPGQTTQTIYNVSAGSYLVTITDYNGCTDTATVTITQPAALVAVTTVSNLFCSGGANGSANTMVSGGIPPYSYVWNTTPVQTSSSATNLMPGTYAVVVTDAMGCATTANASISLPTSPLNATISNTVPVTCNGQANGSASVTISGGSAPYSYFWNSIPFQTTATATNLAAGNYSVVVTDNNGCSDTATVTINQPQTAVSISINNIVHAPCNGTTGGTAVALASGGSSPYTYSWSTLPAQTSSAAYNLAAGVYVATATDANGCTTTQSVTINQPDPITVAVPIVTNNSCYGGANGSASTVATGGTAPYSYQWNTVPAQTSSAASVLTAGNYLVTVTDVNGCTGTAQASVLQPQAIAATTTVSNIACSGSGTGSAMVSVSGGTLPYNYLWNTTPAQTTATANNLPGGAYTVTVTDANGCSTSATATIGAAPSQVIASISNHMDVHCSGGSDGVATVSVSGGAVPYNYFWTTIPAQSSATATGLAAGTYTVTVTDNNGCFDTATVIIGHPSPVNINIQTLRKSCAGMAEGVASVHVSGGVSPYTIQWNNTSIQNGDTISQLAPGIYTIAVMDANGCSQTATAAIQNYPAAVVSAGGDQTICEGKSIKLQATGATSFKWSPDTTLSCTTCADPIASPANTITYTVVGTDINNCSDSDVVQVAVLHRQPVGTGQDHKICSGDTVSLNAWGGGQYQWYPSTGLSSVVLANPIASPSVTTVYKVVIRQNECFQDTLQQLVEVHERPTIELGADHEGVAGSIFQINAHATGADAITWYPTIDLSCESCFHPIATLNNTISYTATVTNELGCAAKDEINIRVVCDNSTLFIANAFTPNGDGQNDIFFPQGRGIKIINSFKIYNRWGEVVHQSANFTPNDPNYGWDGRYKGLSLNPDVFVYVINGICQNDDPVSITGDVAILK